jgi:4-carboxymuconolactone decarboxylase
VTRIPRLTPHQLDDAQRAVYDSIAGGPRATGGAFQLTGVDGSLEGPFNAMLLHPPLGHALQELGAAIRYHGALPDRAREIAILTVAAHWHSAFERYAHERVGRRIGMSEEELTALREGTEPNLADPQEAAVATATRRLLHHNTLTDAEYTEAIAVLGPAKVFELTTLIGYYGLLALQMRVFAADQGPQPACSGQASTSAIE